MAKSRGSGGRGGGRIGVGSIVRPAGRNEFTSVVIGRARGFDPRVGRRVPGYLVRGANARPGQLAYNPSFLPASAAVRVG